MRLDFWMRSTHQLSWTPNSSVIGSPSSQISSPYVGVRDYQQNVENLKNENFTLKYLIWQLRRNFCELLASHNIAEDVRDKMLQQETDLARYASQSDPESAIGTPASAKTVSTVASGYGTPLKLRLEQVLNDNVRLETRLQAQEQRIEELQKNSTRKGGPSPGSKRGSPNVHELEAKVAILEQQRIVIVREKEHLLEQLTVLENVCQENDELRQHNDSLQEENERLAQANEILEQRLEEPKYVSLTHAFAQMNIAHQATEKGQPSHDNDLLRQENQRLHQANEELVKQCEESESQVFSLQEKTIDLGQQVQILREELAQANEKLKQRLKEPKHVSLIHGFAQTNIAHHATEEEREPSHGNDLLKQENQRLHQANQGLQIQCDESETQIVSLQGKTIDLSKQVQSLREELARASRSPDREKGLEAQLKEQNKQITILVKQNNKLVTEIDTLRATQRAISPYFKSIRSSPLTPLQPNRIQRERSHPELTKTEFQQIVFASLNRMIRMFEKRSSTLINHVSTRIEQIFIRIRSLFSKFFRCFRLGIEDAREKFTDFVGLVDVMFSDVRKGALICISSSRAAARAVSKTPIARSDRKKLWELHEKWGTSLGPRLTRIIELENERSLFGGYSPRRAEDQQTIANQCQILIHAIWNLFGEGQPEPDVSSLTTFGVRFETAIQQVIAIQKNGLLKMQSSIQESTKTKSKRELTPAAEQVQNHGKGRSRKRLNTSVGEIIADLKRTVSMCSTRLHEEHIELIEKTCQNHPRGSS
jgi:regulator of replication initiation timing